MRDYTAAEIINILGGIQSTALLTRRAYNQVCNWKASGLFPPMLFLVMQEALRQRGIYGVPPSLWRMEEPAREREVA